MPTRATHRFNLVNYGSQSKLQPLQRQLRQIAVKANISRLNANFGTPDFIVQVRNLTAFTHSHVQLCTHWVAYFFPACQASKKSTLLQCGFKSSQCSLETVAPQQIGWTLVLSQAQWAQCLSDALCIWINLHETPQFSVRFQNNRSAVP